VGPGMVVPPSRCGRLGMKRLSAHPAEPGYPCYVSVLGELAWMPPRGELPPVYPFARRGFAASSQSRTHAAKVTIVQRPTMRRVSDEAARAQVEGVGMTESVISEDRATAQAPQAPTPLAVERFAEITDEVPFRLERVEIADG